MPVPLAEAEGGISLAEQHLAITLADCARFRTWAQNAADRNAALARIYVGDLPEAPNGQDAYTRDQIVGLRPFALILTANQQGYSKAKVGTQTYTEAGKLAVVFEENVPENLADDVANVQRIFKNTVGTILDQLLELAYTAPDDESQYLAIDVVTFHGPIRCREDEIPGEGDHQFAMLELQYGVGVR